MGLVNLEKSILNASPPTLTAMGSNDTTAGAFHWKNLGVK